MYLKVHMFFLEYLNVAVEYVFCSYCIARSLDISILNTVEQLFHKVGYGHQILSTL